MKIQYGNIEFVNVRTEWPNEAQDFTPWVAKNLDKVSTATGLSLELVKQEAQVGPFRTDIVARNKSDGSNVVIENQFEDSDHDHLGKILTYLAGHEALTAIWIAEDFSEPHLAAIRWLNQNTPDSFDFFALQVGVVRVGNSQRTPVFHPVESPNSAPDSRVKIKDSLNLNISHAWQSEAELTLWVKDNLTELSKEISLPFKNVRRNPSTPNILTGRDADGDKVLIENQIIESSYDGVKQTLRRQAQRDAQTVIWIAPDFQEDDLAEIRSSIIGMANPFSLFAVKLEAFRVDGFPTVARFKKLEDMPITGLPMASGSNWSNISDAYQAFWEYYSARYPNTGDPISMPRRISNAYHSVEGTELEVAQFLIEGSVGVFIRKRLNSRTVEPLGQLMRPYIPAFIDELGFDPKNPPIWLTPDFDGPPHIGGRGWVIDWKNPANWEEAAELLHDDLVRYMSIFQEVSRRPFWRYYSDRHSDSVPEQYSGQFAFYPIKDTELGICQFLSEGEERPFTSTLIAKTLGSKSQKSLTELMRPYIPALLGASGLRPPKPPY